MEKYSKKNINNKFPFIIGLFLICSLLFITVGFSALSTSLSIDGSMAFEPVGLIRVMSIKQNKLVNTTEQEASITPDSIKNTIELNDLTSTATYTVVIRNLGQVDYQLKSINEKIFSNNNVEYSLDTFHIGDVIKAKESVTFNITFKYKNSVTTLSESRLNSELQFEFKEYVDLGDNIKSYDKLIFDGTNYVDTGIKLFSEENINKNFEIYFDIDEINGPPFNDQAAIVNALLEVSPWPGFVFRHQRNDTKFEFNSPATSSRTFNINDVHSVYIKRYNDTYYLQINNWDVINLGKSKNPTTFDIPVTFGASLNQNKEPWRYFKGTLSNVYIKVFDTEKYLIKYDANGGTGSMDNQSIRVDDTAPLLSNNFQKEDYIFDCWNTKPDGTGQKFAENENVMNLASNGESITLYAMWVQDMEYTINYNANDGTNASEHQKIRYGETKEIQPSKFINDDGLFLKWNTKPDGTGVDYRPGQSVKNLTQNPDDVIELYAVWQKYLYTHEGEYQFTGNNYINTEVYLFTDQTINMDFELSFEIESREKYNSLDTMMSSNDETANPWPGIIYRLIDLSNDQVTVNSNASKKLETNYPNKDITKVSFKRTNNVISVAFNDGEYEQLQDTSDILHTFEVPVTFGASLNGSKSPWRYFKGTLKNMKVQLYK